MTIPSFDLLGAAEPASPLILSVPHAGRAYPANLAPMLRAPVDALLALEDRHVDRVAVAARRDETMLVARRPRLWIDLNRAEHERDPLIDDGAGAASSPFVSAKVRGGLGLVPRRVTGVGDIWRRRLGADEVAARIMADHRPYHDMLADLLRRARARFGVAVLVDIHSMPAIGDGTQMVIGDRFGRSAANRFVARIEGAARDLGLKVALNSPYPGGHILDRHGAPGRAIHAVQIEFDRALYLDATLKNPGEGMTRTAAALRAVLDALIDEISPAMQAAE